MTCTIAFKSLSSASSSIQQAKNQCYISWIFLSFPCFELATSVSSPSGFGLPPLGTLASTSESEVLLPEEELPSDVSGTSKPCCELSAPFMILSAWETASWFFKSSKPHARSRAMCGWSSSSAHFQSLFSVCNNLPADLCVKLGLQWEMNMNTPSQEIVRVVDLKYNVWVCKLPSWAQIRLWLCSALAYEISGLQSSDSAKIWVECLPSSSRHAALAVCAFNAELALSKAGRKLWSLSSTDGGGKGWIFGFAALLLPREETNNFLSTSQQFVSISNSMQSLKVSEVSRSNRKPARSIKQLMKTSAQGTSSPTPVTSGSSSSSLAFRFNARSSCIASYITFEQFYQRRLLLKAVL